ncbi:hypothetical protein HYW54_05535 [Candidatus Gottesmanbacteria bacterium]|nr:hypothetical protein [Candidatus Gottesmanbacteria bacterium]
MAQVIPAILEKDFGEIERKIQMVAKWVDWVQIDIADNTLVPNTTFLDAAPFKNLKTSLKLEVHMMVKDPIKYLQGYIDSGFKRIIAHVEGDHIEDFIVKGEEANIEVGLAIDGPTQLEKIAPYLRNIDVVLVMAIEAGFSGQEYREDTGEKIRKIKEMEFDLPIAVDGAMNLENAKKVVSAGATRINSNSYIFGAEDIKGAVQSLKEL